FTLTGPNPRFFANMYRSYILPKHAVDFAPKDYAATDWWVTPGKQVGSGPFFVSDHKKDEYLELAPNPHYFAGKPKLEKLIIRFFGGNITSAVLALAAGDTAFSYVNFDDMATLGEDDFNYYAGNSTVVVMLDLNYKNLPDYWKDIRVRQAILYAIDRQTIVDQVLQGTHSVLAGPVGFEQFYSDKVNMFEYNPEKAKALLAEAGVKPGDIEMNIISHAGYNNALNNAALQASQAYLAQIGITKFNYKFLDIPSFRAAYKADGDWEFGYRGWGYPIFGANPNFLMSNSGGQGGDFSGYDYDSQGFPEVIANVTSATTLDGYFQALTELNDLHNSQLPELFMWVGDRFGAASKQVKDFHWIPAGGGGPYVDHAEKWYIAD
ncbi:MAG: ABC transporter substrate-binding protein, partial [bacterium]|nr:ABC transporter substrate-binding protein [bacterium]